MWIRTCLFIVLLLFALQPGSLLAAEPEKDERPRPQIYPLTVKTGQTFGGWMWVIENCKEYEVCLAKDSNKEAAEALNGIKEEILLLNTNCEYNVYLVGYLDTEKVIQGRQSKQTSFRLDAWYIKAPFLAPPNLNPDPVDGPIEVVPELLPSHFLVSGDQEGSASTKKFRASLKIYHEPLRNVYWLGPKSLMNEIILYNVKQPEPPKKSKAK